MIAKLTIRNLQANAGRFAMTTFGVVLAVSFVVSAFVLGDGLRQTFGNLSNDIVAGTDLEIRPVEEFGATQTLDEADVATALTIDGVAQAVGLVEAAPNSVRPIPSSGEEISTSGPPQLAFSWTDQPGLSAFTLVEGESPQPGEFLIDLDSADRHDFEIGSAYTVISSTGRHELTLSGLTQFGSDNQTLGAVLMGMNATETDALFGTVGYDSIGIALTDTARADLASVQQSVQDVFADREVLNQASLADETAAEFNTQIDIIQYILLGFAGISLVVSVFIIGNTFAIVLQQRTREMGLLRLVGADASQLRRGALGEAAGIGVLASAIGIPGGIGVAAGLTGLLGAIGLQLPDYDIIVSNRTIGIALAVGIGVTLAAAYLPTRAASNVAPIAALRTGSAGRTPSYRGRTIAASIFGGLGAIAAGLGVMGAGSTTATVTLMALGALAIFAAVTLISPRLVAPAVALFALLFERLGMPGRMAIRNARRQAGRTATTAAALMIGLAVVSMALVVGESVKAQLGQSLDTAVTADYLLTDQVAEAGFPTSVIDELAAEPAVSQVSGFRIAEMQTADEIVEVTAARFDDLPSLLELGIVDGELSSAPNAAMLSLDEAEATALGVGDSIEVTMENGVQTSLQIAGIFEEDAIIVQDYLVDVALFDEIGLTSVETWVAFNGADTASAEAVAAAVAQIEERYPQGELETASEFRERMEGLVDQILQVMNALVALAVVIALIGIANTLALSVSERTREIGLARAVGMSRAGVRRMIRYESAIIAAFGAVLGVLMGIGLGWLTVEALPASFTDTLAVPTTQILTLVVVAAAAGLLAALLPARRAGRMNVLEAIAH